MSNDGASRTRSSPSSAGTDPLECGTNHVALGRHPVDVREADRIRPARHGDRDAILAIVRASGLFPAPEVAEVTITLDAFLAGTTDDR